MRPTSVYVMECQGRVKIGIAVSPEARRHHLSVAAPFPVQLIASRELASHAAALNLERRMHAQFHALRVHGEWFAADPATVAAKLAEFREITADELAAGHEVPMEELRAALEAAAR